jgi:hypothetical protein
MKLWKMILLGVIVGIVMGLALFVTGAVASRLVYGPQMAPAGKFKPEQINAWYFMWTKLLIGVFFGVLLTVLYEKLPLSKRIDGVLTGVKYSLLLWLAAYLWELSHPLVYGGLASFDRNQFFWLVYSAGGFLGLGIAFGWLRRRLSGSTA